MTRAWSGRAVQQARAALADRTQWPTPCARGCGKVLTLRDRWVCGHIYSRVLRPDLTWEASNHQVECRACSDASAQAAVVEKAFADGIEHAKRGYSSTFPDTDGPGQPPPLPLSLPAASQGQPEARADLLWTPDTLAAHAWLTDLLPIPEDASPPLWMSPPPEDAVCSYGWDGCEHLAGAAAAVSWIEETLRITLRWWQRLAIVRQLEHREDGTLCHREIVESAPRRAGKSLRIKGLVLWRMEHGYTLFGEAQTIVHTGSDVAVCRKLQKESWTWAQRRRWTVTKANGKEAIENASAQWLVRSQDGVYGWDVMFGLVDEGWDVKPDTVTEGLEPATMERASPQLHLTSTAHRRATSLMRAKIADALATADPEVLLLVWAAPFGSDPADPEVWRAASPHWSQDRRKMIARKYTAAAAGQADPEADDPDPMAGFEAQYLNIWRLRERKAAKGSAIVEAADWEALDVEPPFDRPDAVAIESRDGEGISVAFAWRVGEQSVVGATDHPDLASAAAAVRESGFTGYAIVGASLYKDPALRGIRQREGKGRAVTAVQELSRLMAEDVVRHDGSPHLSGQVLDARTMPTADGLRMASSARADAIKAAVWAVERSRKARSSVMVVTARESA
jgi:phage terminase large subunit-like protein